MGRTYRRPSAAARRDVMNMLDEREARAILREAREREHVPLPRDARICADTFMRIVERLPRR